MPLLPQRLRAALAIGFTWGAAWLGAGLLLLLFVGFGAADVPFPLFFGFLGFLAGVIFAGVLGVAARGRRFDRMSLPRFAAWGALGGALLSLTALGTGGEFLVVLPVLAVAGAGSAAATLALARRSEAGTRLTPGRDPDQLPGTGSGE